MSTRYSSHLVQLIPSLPRVLVQEIAEFAFSEDEIERVQAGVFGIHTFDLTPPTHPRGINNSLDIYESLDYNSTRVYYPRIQDLHPRQRAVIVSQVFERYTPDHLIFTSEGNPDTNPKRVLYTFHWIVKRWREVNTRESIQERYDHFRQVNWSNNYLKGERHVHRFMRGTKVFIVKGVNRGRHATIVGHSVDFALYRDSPKLKLLLADYSIVTVLQSNVQLIDLHFHLPFAIPFDPHLQPVHFNWGSTPTFWNHRVNLSGWFPTVDPFQERINHGWGTL